MSESVLAALAVEHAPERAEYTLEQLLGELVDPRPELLAVDVHKRRRHVTVGGAMAELSELSTDRGVLRTIAVESEDPALVTAAVRELGLDLRPNVSVPRGLKELVALRPLRRGRRRHQLGQVRDRRAARGRRVADGRRPGRGDAPRRGARPDAASSTRSRSARTVEAIAAMAEEAARAEVVAVDRGRHRGPAHRAQQRRVRRGRARAHRDRGRDHQRGRGGSAGVSSP